VTDIPLVAINLDDDERRFMVEALNEYFGAAKRAVPFLSSSLGASSDDEFRALVWRLLEAIDNGQPLSELDWSRALFLAEISWASDLVGSGLDFATRFRDEDAVELVRSVQHKTVTPQRYNLLRDNAKIVAN